MTQTRPKTDLAALSQGDVRPVAAAVPPASAARGTKRDMVVSLLRQPEGATIATVMAATGWQAHSVRGFLTSVVRQKLGLDLTSEVVHGERTYRVVTPKPVRTRSGARKAGVTVGALA